MKTRGKLAAGARRVWLCTLAMSGAALLSSVAVGEESSPPAEHAPGSWQKHQYSFVFMGFTSTYSCDGLADRLKTLLIAVGARPDAKSQPGACAAPFGRPDKFARADLTFYTLSAAAPAASSKPVDGVWRPVTLTNHSPRDLELGDCELVEQFRNQVLPMFTTRSIEDHTTCIPHQESGSEIDLKFDSLVAAPQPGAATRH